MNSLWIASRDWKKHQCQAGIACSDQYRSSLHFTSGRCKIWSLGPSKCFPTDILLANYVASFADQNIRCTPFHRSLRPSIAKSRSLRIQSPDFPISHRNELVSRLIYAWWTFFCVMSMNSTRNIVSFSHSQFCCRGRLESVVSLQLMSIFQRTREF
jgi:hypothetical protein